MVEYGFYGSGGVCGCGVGDICLYAVAGKQRVGVALIAIEREVLSSCRLSNDEHTYVFTVVGDGGIGEGYLFLVTFLYFAVIAYGVYRVRPWHQKAAELCGVVVYPKGVAHVC